MSSKLNLAVGVDGELRARDAVGLACNLAEASGSQVHMVHVLESTRSWWPIGSLVDDAELKAQIKGAELRLGQVFPPEVELHVLTGHPVRQLNDFCRKNRIDLLILGRLHEGRNDPLIGGTARRVLQTSSCPVMVQRVATTAVPRRFLVAFDLSPGGTRALQFAIRCAELLGGTVHVLYIFETVELASAAGLEKLPEDRIDQIRQAEFRKVDEILRGTDWHGVPHDVKKIEGDPGILILKAVDRKDVNVVFMGTRGRTDLDNITLGRVAQYVSRRNPRTVLVP